MMTITLRISDKENEKKTEDQFDDKQTNVVFENSSTGFFLSFFWFLDPTITIRKTILFSS